MFFRNDNVAEVPMSGVICDDARDPNLRAIAQQAEVHRMPQAFLDNLTTAARRPIGRVQESANTIEIEPRRIVRETIPFMMPIHVGQFTAKIARRNSEVSAQPESLA